MKINPTAQKKRSHTITDDAIAITPKKLKRLPHVFAKVLELPFNSDVDVFVQETSESFRFLADSAIANDFRLHLIKIIPGVTKIQVRGANDRRDSSIDECDDDIQIWRVRLPPTTLPEMAMAECIDGQLVVTVPKVNLNCDDDNNKASVFGLEKFGTRI